jgi:hypothetical protein
VKRHKGFELIKEYGYDSALKIDPDDVSLIQYLIARRYNAAENRQWWTIVNPLSDVVYIDNVNSMSTLKVFQMLLQLCQYSKFGEPPNWQLFVNQQVKTDLTLIELVTRLECLYYLWLYEVCVW